MGQPDQCVWGLGNADNFSEWHLCQNLTGTSTHLPLVIFQKAHLGFGGAHADVWLPAGADQKTACAMVPAHWWLREQAATWAALGRREDSG